MTRSGSGELFCHTEAASFLRNVASSQAAISAAQPEAKSPLDTTGLDWRGERVTKV